MNPIITISKLSKKYEDGLHALNAIDLTIPQGEIFALLGPNGAGKTTLISMICGLTTITSGTVKVGGFDIVSEPRSARTLIGLVPQELTTDMFITVLDTVNFSRGLFGLKPDPIYLESLIKKLCLWDKRDKKLMTLSGGMKRRVMIAKALAHEPQILFLDEPTAGVDVELRRNMWQQIRTLQESGVTIILTTHYIAEAEAMADSVGVIRKGSIILVEEKRKLMKKLGKKHLSFDLIAPISTLPPTLSQFGLSLSGNQLHYDYDSKNGSHNISSLFEALKAANISYKDIQTKERTLEEIFVELVKEK
ncbi:MAG: ABC-2 type transport system ATP-binding protein [Candidatus Marinamargulisbacteria bacterium]|jgi:ABC-2 type transport system ATP-binding protein